MNVGKAIYYLLSNSTGVTDICGTRIFPEVAEQESATPLVVYEIINVDPDDTNDGPAKVDEVTVDVVCYADTYDVAADLASVCRVALDRVRGTYNGVNIQSIQFTTVDSQVIDSPRRYVMAGTFIVRVQRDLAQIATGQNIDDLTILRLADTPSSYGTTGQALVVNADGDGMEWGETASDLGDLPNVTLDDPQDREALVYNEDTNTWINGASTKLAIRVINLTGVTLYSGTPVKASGVQGDQVSVTLYRATEDPKRFIGLLDGDIANGGTGYARQTGTIYNLNTLAFSVGQILYPAEANAGLDNGLDYMTATLPGSNSNVPVAKIPAAIVLRRHFTTGRVYVRTWSPDSKLEELANVFAPFKSVGDVLRWNGSQWASGVFVQPALGELADVASYNPATLKDKTSIRWDAFAQQWALVPASGGLPDVITYFLNRYDAEANTARQLADATLTIERYVTVQADGHGEKSAAQSNTPSVDNKIVRKIWHKATAFEDSDVTTWTLAHTFADNTAYIDTIDTFQGLLLAATYGSIPLTLAQTWEDVPVPAALLDGYTDDLVGAFAPVLLVPGYEGACLRVRRSGDNAEQDIGFDGIDLDTAALATFCAGTDGFVKTWYNQDGSGNHAAQGTNSRQPKIYDAATGVELENAVPAPLFDGVTGGQGLFGTTISATSSAFSAFAVRNRTKTASPDNYIFDSYIAPDRVNFDTLGNALSIGGQNFTPLFGGSGQTLISVFSSSAGTSGYTDGVDKNLTGGTHVDQRIGQFSIGNFVLASQQTGFGGTIQAIILYAADKSADRAAIETALNDYFNVY